MLFSRKKDIRETGIAATSAAALLLKILIYVVGFVGSIVVSRALGPEGRGAYYLPMVAASTVVALSKLGLQNANVFLLGTRGISAERLSSQNALVALVMGSIGVLALLQGHWVLPSVFGQTPYALLLLAALTIPFSIHQQYSAALLNLQGTVTWQFKASLLSGLAQLAALVGLAVSGHLDPFMVLLVNLFTIATTWGLTQIAFDARSRFRVRVDIGLLKETLSNSLILHLAMVLFFLHLRLDTFMIQALAGQAAVGQYSVSVTLAETLMLASESLAAAILPRLVGDSLRESALLSLRGARMNVLISLILSAGWALAGYWVITLFYGPEFTPAFLPLLALLPGITALGVQRCTGGPVLRTGAPWKFASIYGVSMLANIGLNLVLIPLLGITGAAIASSVSYTLEALLFISWVARIGDAKVTEGIIPNRADLLRLLAASHSGILALTRLSGTRRFFR